LFETIEPRIALHQLRTGVDPSFPSPKPWTLSAKWNRRYFGKIVVREGG